MKRVPWWAWALVGCIVVAGVAAPFASSLPDGLEAALERWGLAENERTQPAPLPDYATPGVESEKPSVFIAGAVGILVVFGLTFALSRLLARRQAAPVPDPGDA